jgi:AFG3 family protein
MEDNKRGGGLPPGFDKNNPKNKGPKFNMYWIYGLIVVALIGLNLFAPSLQAPEKQTSFLDFKRDYLDQGKVAKVIIVNKENAEVFLTKEARATQPKPGGNPMFGSRSDNEPDFSFNIGDYEVFDRNFQEAMKPLVAAGQKEVPVFVENRGSFLRDFFAGTFPILLIMVILWIFVFRKMGPAGGGAGGGIFSIGKSKAQLFEKGTKVNITFNDVAGLDEAKVEVMEIVDFLKNPKKYTSLGGKIPKGALLVGPPGTGKTLLAKAVAGEAQVPFFSMSGSDFVEMFVGVGASRVRDLFKQARDKAPCIVFIDEIDAIGRARGKNAVMSNDERENTLNQLLVEMDGFSGDSGIIILAATNRPDVLDTALLRPGRFDRQISIDVPDVNGREKIFNVHLQPIKKAADLDIKKLASQTPGFAGADIANICNEAALIAARKGQTEVHMQDFNDAIDRVIGGLEKKNKIISPEEKKIIAFHEAGHAVCGWFLEHAHPLVKVSIVPRGVAALGYAQYLPKEQFLYTTEQMNDQLVGLFGGRAAEELIFGRVSTGAQNDLERITKMAYSMISIYGFNGKVGNVSFHDSQQEYATQKPYSEATAEMIDREVRLILETEYQRAKTLLSDHMNELTTLAQELLKKEVIYKDDLERLIGKRPYDDTQAGDVLPAADSLPVSEAIKNKDAIAAKSEDAANAADAALES